MDREILATSGTNIPVTLITRAGEDLRDGIANDLLANPPTSPVDLEQLYKEQQGG